ncbi:hypothetical protein JCM33774_73420 [Actinophytocola sp. KF-1]
MPVPCVSTSPTWSGVTRACASARRITAVCAGPLGAVMLLVRPSWPIAVPRTTAQTGSPSRSAADSRFSTTTPAPSARTNPFAAASNVLHRPSGASMPSFA